MLNDRQEMFMPPVSHEMRFEEPPSSNSQRMTQASNNKPNLIPLNMMNY